MSLLDLILGIKSVYRLRKEYDRLREKADKEHDMNRRTIILRQLDSIEPTIVALEEQTIISNFEKKRMRKYAQRSLSQAKMMIKNKEYFAAMIKQQYERSKK
jgi:hypothetical protein